MTKKHTNTCAACVRFGTGFGADPLFIAEMRECFAVLHQHQCLRGWCVLLLKEHVEHLSLLPIRRQGVVFEEVAKVAAAIKRVCSPKRVNYECLGNVMAHVHWHIVPRYELPMDPDPLRAIWVQPQEFLECGHDAAAAAALTSEIRAALSMDDCGE